MSYTPHERHRQLMNVLKQILDELSKIREKLEITTPTSRADEVTE